MDASTNTGTQQETRIFVSYAREDAKWLDKNNPHNLIPFLRESLRRHNVTFWFDKELKGGDVFEQHIAAEIDNSQIALLIVSQCFLNSEFIENKEMPRIHERAKQGNMIVVPVLVEPCDWSDYPFLADRQMVPGPMPLIEYTESEAQWAKVKFQILDGLKAQAIKIQAVKNRVQARNNPPAVLQKSIPVDASANVPVISRVPSPKPISCRVGEVRTLHGHSEAVKTVAFSPDGGTLATGSIEKTIMLWDAASGRALAPLLSEGGTHTLAFSPDGRILAAGISNCRISLLDVASGRTLHILRHLGASVISWITSLAFSSDGQILASGSYSSGAIVWNVESGDAVGSLHVLSDEGQHVAFCPNGYILAIGGEHSYLKLWDVMSPKHHFSLLDGLLEKILFGGYVYSLAFSRDGRILAAGGMNGVIKIWNIENELSLCHTLQGEHSFFSYHYVNSLAFSPNGYVLASGNSDKTITLWDVDKGNILRPLVGHSKSVNSVAFSPDGRTLATASDDLTVKLWDVSDLT
jgi:hypothetical protein